MRSGDEQLKDETETVISRIQNRTVNMWFQKDSNYMLQRVLYG